MRRPPAARSAVAALALLVVLAAIAYGAMWYYVTGQIREAVIGWAEACRVEGVTVGWDRLDVGGFPFGFAVRLEKPVLGQTALDPGYDLRAPLLVATATPWSLATWRFEAAQGLEAALQP